MKFLIMQPPTTSSPLGPNIPLSTLFSGALNMCSSLSGRGQIWHSYKTTGGITILNIWSLSF
jgi:hypothetical protein